MEFIEESHTSGISVLPLSSHLVIVLNIGFKACCSSSQKTNKQKNQFNILDIHTYIHTYQVLVCLIFGTLRTSPFPRSCFSVSEESAQPFGNVALESISFCLYVFPISMIQLCCLSLFVLPCISFFLLKNKSLLLFLI